MDLTKIIFIDMDGVIADLDSAFENWVGYHPDIHPDRSAFFDEFLPEYSINEGFYTQTPMRKAQKLINFLVGISTEYEVKLAMLTSIGHFIKPNSLVLDQKKRWINRNFPELNYIPMCATSSGKDKSIFANKNTFLIDDHPSNIEHFIENGGNGFIYKEQEFEKLKKELLKFVNKEKEV